MKEKIKIDLDPTAPITFDRIVEIPTPSGKPLKLPLRFTHRPVEAMEALRKGWAAELEESKAKADAAVGAEPQETTPAQDAKALDEALDKEAERILSVATDWGIDAYEFNAENIKKLLRFYPAASMTIFIDYMRGMREGRLGN